MKALVLGAGLQGSVLVRDLVKSDWVEEVLVGSMDVQRLKQLEAIDEQKVEGKRVDVRDRGALIKLMRDIDIAINGSDWRYNHVAAEAAIEAGVNLIDMGTIFDEVLEKQLKLHKAAEDAKVTIIPCCGLSPGITNVLVWYGTSKLDRVEEVRIRCGGIPQIPKPPLGYKVVWSLDGVIDEYTERVAIVRNGELEYVEPLSGLESITFDNIPGKFECFYTQGLSTLPDSLKEVREMDYKTVRYPGHCERIKMLASLGFMESDPIEIKGHRLTPREFLVAHLNRVLELGADKDMVILRIDVIGEKGRRKERYTFNMLDLFDEKNGVTAMARTTVYPCSITAEMIAKGEISVRGVIPPERGISPEPFIARLARRGIHIDEKFAVIERL